MNCYFKIKDIKDVSRIIKETFDVDLRNFTLVLLKLRYEQFCDKHKITNATTLINIIEVNKELKRELFAFVFENEFELFRDPALWRSLKEDVLPTFSRDILYKVWIPSCFEGSELLSFLILREEMDLVDKIQVIYSTPLKELNRVKLGFKFNERKHGLNCSNYKRIEGVDLDEKYFVKKLDLFVPVEKLFKNTIYKEFCEIKNGVLNKTVNLILYRNRLLRYNRNLQLEVCDNLFSSLKTGGFLSLGIKEIFPVDNSMKRFITFNTKESIYKKK